MYARSYLSFLFERELIRYTNVSYFSLVLFFLMVLLIALLVFCTAFVIVCAPQVSRLLPDVVYFLVRLVVLLNAPLPTSFVVSRN